MSYGTLTITVTPGVSDTGQAIRVSAVCKDATGTLVTPATLTFTFNNPDGTVSTAVLGGTVVTDSTGNFHVDYLPSVSGLFRGTGVATVPNAADDFSFEAQAVGNSTAWTPSSDDVAALLAHLTVDATGVPTGKFSTTSSPTATQVTVLVEDIVGEIAAAAGPVPPVLYADAKLVAILGTAALVELSFSDQSDVLANLLATRYQNALARLTLAVSEVNDSGQVFPEGVPPAPLFSFPDITCLDYTTVFSTW